MQADNSKKLITALMISDLFLGVGLKSVLDMISAMQIIILMPLIDS